MSIRNAYARQRKMPVPTEGEEQATLFNWARMQSGKYPELKLCFHIPNGGSRNNIEAKHLKAQGVKAGVPDLFLPVARGNWHGLFIEMKQQEGFVGVNLQPPRGTLLLFRTENNAKGARNALLAAGVVCGTNICKVFVDKKYVPEEKP